MANRGPPARFGALLHRAPRTGMVPSRLPYRGVGGCRGATARGSTETPSSHLVPPSLHNPKRALSSHSFRLRQFTFPIGRGWCVPLPFVSLFKPLPTPLFLTYESRSQVLRTPSTGGWWGGHGTVSEQGPHVSSGQTLRAELRPERTQKVIAFSLALPCPFHHRPAHHLYKVLFSRET